MGCDVGCDVGARVDGEALGAREGCDEGTALGREVGAREGAGAGAPLRATSAFLKLAVYLSRGQIPGTSIRERYDTFQRTLESTCPVGQFSRGRTLEIVP